METCYKIFTQNIIWFYEYTICKITKNMENYHVIIGSDTEFSNGLWVGPLRKMIF
jgi:hypothetical protein